MASKEIMEMPADALFERWQQHMERIKNETIYLFTTRYRWREISKLFKENPELNRLGHDIYQYFLRLWGHDALMGIRRELDDQAGTINLRNLLYEMEARPEVVTRGRCLPYKPDQSELLRRVLDDQFTNLGAISTDSNAINDYLPGATFRTDRETLEEKTREAFVYAQRMVAHRTPIDDLRIDQKTVHVAVDAIEPVVQKYYALLVGPTLASATASIVWNWMEVFTIPWLVKKDPEQ